MDEERLLRIKVAINSADYHFKQGNNDLGREILESLNDRCDTDWLIEQAEKVKKLEENIEKIKPFIQLFNEYFITNLAIGQDEINSTFGHYRLVKVTPAP